MLIDRRSFVSEMFKVYQWTNSDQPWSCLTCKISHVPIKKKDKNKCFDLTSSLISLSVFQEFSVMWSFDRTLKSGFFSKFRSVITEIKKLGDFRMAQFYNLSRIKDRNL